VTLPEPSTISGTPPPRPSTASRRANTDYVAKAGQDMTTNRSNLLYRAKFDPHAGTIVAGKLYLNYLLSVRERWAQNKAGNIAKEEANWPRLKKAL